MLLLTPDLEVPLMYTQTNSGPVTPATIPYIRGTSETIARKLQPIINQLSTTKTNRRTDREQYTRSNAAT